MTVVHNFSSHSLTQSHLGILNKGLSFSPACQFNLKSHFAFLSQFDLFGNSIRKIAISNREHNKTQIVDQDNETMLLYREMKFLREISKESCSPPFFTVNVASIENFIENTKIKIDKQLTTATNKHKKNMSNKELKAINSLKKLDIVIKPADKNLGIAVMDNSDYVNQCLLHLISDTYIKVDTFPTSEIKRSIINLLVSFKNELVPHRKLYRFLHPNQKHMIPSFYGLPKVHKELDSRGIPPLRPIVAHTDSLLSKTARFIDHVLQPLAQFYKDYLKNSTQLISFLGNSTVPNDVILVTMDVSSLYPSIPQKECLEIVRNEMFKHQHLMIFNPNLIAHLLNINMNNNYFEFGGNIVLQTKGTAMGAPFSPTIANIFMSEL